MSAAASCTKHPSEMAAASCRRCIEAWCADCLVYAFGTDQPPFCVTCALFAAGVRARGRPAPSRKELRARKKAERLAAKAQVPVSAPVEPDPLDHGYDWSKPFFDEPTPAPKAY